MLHTAYYKALFKIAVREHRKCLTQFYIGRITSWGEFNIIELIASFRQGNCKSANGILPYQNFSHLYFEYMIAFSVNTCRIQLKLSLANCTVFSFISKNRVFFGNITVNLYSESERFIKCSIKIYFCSFTKSKLYNLFFGYIHFAKEEQKVFTRHTALVIETICGVIGNDIRKRLEANIYHQRKSCCIKNYPLCLSVSKVILDKDS